MSKVNVVTLLASDDRFIKRGKLLQALSLNLSEIFNDEEIVNAATSSITSYRNTAAFLNLLQYANKQNDSLIEQQFDKTQILEVITNGIVVLGYQNLADSDVKDILKSDYIEYKDLDIEHIESATSAKSDFISNWAANNVTSLSSAKKSSSTSEFKSVESKSNIKSKQAVKSSTNVKFDVDDDEYWVQSVRLDFPMIPQPNSRDVRYETTAHNQQYCIYGESILPWNQSQITCLTDVNRFNKSDILRLFPLIRLYTRSPYMYREYDKLDYDEDLGVIFKISGFTQKQIRQNILEYPHLDFLDREVKINGKMTTIPFWKHIEIDGEIQLTASIWGQTKDTKNLPKTESFMREYVVRKYILESTLGGIEHKYPMRGSLKPFLTLYAPPEYYIDHGYDPFEIGRKCIEARQSFKFTRNPVVKLNQVNAEMSV